MSHRPGLRLLLVAALLCLLFCLVGSAFAIQHYQNVHRAVVSETEALARAAAQTVDEILEQRLALLQAVATTPVVRSRDPHAVLDYFTALGPEGDLGFTGGLGWIDLQGQLRILSTQPLDTPPLDLSDREYVRATLAAGRPFVSAAMLSRRTGRPVVVLAAPTFSEAGDVHGILVGSIRLDQFETGLRSLSTDGALVVIDRHNQVIADAQLATLLDDLSALPVIAEMRAAGAGVRTELPNLRSEPDQLIGYATAATGDWLVMLVRPTGQTLSLARRALMGELLGLALVALVSLGSAGLVARRLDRLADREKEARQRAERVAAKTARLQAVTASLARVTTPTEVAQVLAYQGAALLGADASVVAYAHAEGRCLEVAAISGYAADSMRLHQRVPLTDHTPLTDAVTSGQAIWLESAADKIAQYPHLEPIQSQTGYRALAVTPLVAAGQIVGVMSMAYRADRPFWAEDRAFALALSRLAGQAVERAQLSQAEQRQAKQMWAVADLGRLINAAPHLAAMLATVTEQARTIIGAHQAITSLREGEDWTRGLHHVSLSGKNPVVLEDTTPPNGVWLYHQVSGENRPLRLTRSECLRHPACLPARAGANGQQPGRGWLAAPLIGRDGRNMGLIQMSDKVDDADFSAQDEAILVQIAQLAAGAIEMARLYEAERAAHIAATGALRAREEMAAAIAHDLKNPLTVIQGHASLALRRLSQGQPPDTAALPATLSTIHATVTSASGLLDDLMDAARLEAGRPLDLRRAPCDLVTLTRDLVESQQRLTDRHTLTLHVAEPCLVGHWDPSRLQRAIGNLVSNAVKYSPNGGEVRVELARDMDNATLTIHDTGIGIPGDELPYIFDLYHRGRHAVGITDGAGLGLPATRQIVQQHGGTITVTSVEGVSSTFTIRLPLVSAEPPRDSEGTWK